MRRRFPFPSRQFDASIPRASFIEGGVMKTREVRTAADARRIVEERGIRHVKLGLVDVDGVMRGKYVSREKFFSALEGGFGFCDVVLGWDSNDQLVDNLAYTGWHTAYPDAPARILPESCREIPFESDALFFLAEFAPPPRRSVRAACSAGSSHGRARSGSSPTAPSNTSSSSSRRRRIRCAKRITAT